MNEQNTKTLYDRYPEIFRQKDLPITQSCMASSVVITASIGQVTSADDGGGRVQNKETGEDTDTVRLALHTPVSAIKLMGSSVKNEAICDQTSAGSIIMIS